MIYRKRSILLEKAGFFVCIDNFERKTIFITRKLHTMRKTNF